TLLEAFRNAPSTILKGFFPDPLETNSAHALKPVELPRHFKEERDSREDSVASRTGLIRLFNHLLKVRLSVKVITQLVRALLGWNAAGAMTWTQCWSKRLLFAPRLWWLIARNVVSLSLPVSLIARAELAELLGINGKSDAKGVEAGYIIFNPWAWFIWLWERSFWLLLGLLPLTFALATIPALLLLGLYSLPGVDLPAHLSMTGLTGLRITLIIGLALSAWAFLLTKKSVFSSLLKHYHIFRDLGDSYALRAALVQNFDPNYYGEFKFDDSVRRALKHESPSQGGDASKKLLKSYSDNKQRKCGMVVLPIAANLGSGKLEAVPRETSVVDALMCACAVVPFFRAQSIKKDGAQATFIDGSSMSNDPIMPVFEEACKILSHQSGSPYDRLRIISVPLLPLDQETLPENAGPFTGLIDVALRARQLQRYQDMLLDKSLIDRVNRSLNGRPATIGDDSGKTETLLPAKIRLVAPVRAHHLGLRITQAGSVAERRELIDTAVADGCRAMIERLVTDALPDTRTLEERRRRQEPDEEMPDEWPHRDESNQATLRNAVESLRAAGQTVTRSDGTEYVSCRRLLAAWGGITALPGSDPANAANPEPGPGISEVCRKCITCPAQTGADGKQKAELRQHVRLPRATPSSFIVPPPPEPQQKGPAVVFLFSGGVFRGVFQVGFANAVSELGIQPDVVAGASVGTIIGAFTGRVFAKPAGYDLVERQRQTRRLAATFLTVDRFVLTDRFADFIRHFAIHVASAEVSPHDIDMVFRRYEADSGFTFSRRARRVFSGMERLFYLTPFELIDLARALRTGDWQGAAKQTKKLLQDMVDRYGVGLELLGSEPLKQLIDGFIFQGKPPARARFDHFGFSLMGTTTNLTLGKLDILRTSHPWDPRFTQGLLASSAFPAVFRPRWSWEVYRDPQHVAQYADGGIMDNLPMGAVVEYLWGTNAASKYERRPEIPHLILTATLEPEKADWTGRTDLCKMSWMEIRARATQLRYNGKVDKFQKTQRDIRHILTQRALEKDPDFYAPDLPLNLDVLAVKPQWLCGTFAFHPMLGFSRKKQAESIAHGCASTICAVADHFDPGNKAHAVDVDLLRSWARGRGIALNQLPERVKAGKSGALDFGPANLTDDEQKQGFCWFRRPDKKTGQRPICPFHPNSPACTEGEEVSPDLHNIYHACGRRSTHEARNK
ncbi:MAG: patatin-like phospholipase family protein, partial [Verrucomicrobia bacterium]|nr:patatin-like phospholipase family protein [Verrucomicrobiota bacterium]